MSSDPPPTVLPTPPRRLEGGGHSTHCIHSSTSEAPVQGRWAGAGSQRVLLSLLQTQGTNPPREH